MYNIYRYMFLGIGKCWEIDKPEENHSNMNNMNHHYKITLQPQGMSEFGNMCLFWTLLGTQSFGATLRILNSPSLGLAFCREKLLRFMMCIQEPILWCLGDPSGDGLLGWSLWGVMVVNFWSRWWRWQRVTGLQLFVSACISKNDFAYSPDPFFNTQPHLAGKFLALYTKHQYNVCRMPLASDWRRNALNLGMAAASKSPENWHLQASRIFDNW